MGRSERRWVTRRWVEIRGWKGLAGAKPRRLSGAFRGRGGYISAIGGYFGTTGGLYRGKRTPLRRLRQGDPKLRYCFNGSLRIVCTLPLWAELAFHLRFIPQSHLFEFVAHLLRRLKCQAGNPVRAVTELAPDRQLRMQNARCTSFRRHTWKGQEREGVRSPFRAPPPTPEDQDAPTNTQAGAKTLTEQSARIREGAS